MKLGAWIRSQRIAQGWSQGRLASTDHGDVVGGRHVRLGQLLLGREMVAAGRHPAFDLGLEKLDAVGERADVGCCHRGPPCS